MSSIQQLEDECKKLAILLKDKSSMLYIKRLFKIANITDTSTISDIKLKFTDHEKWSISYKHKTSNYNISDYVCNEDSEIETNTPKQLTRISNMRFGLRNNNYYIVGNSESSKFSIFRLSSNVMRAYNIDYEIELDQDEQYDLLTRYSENINIPEWLALRVFIYMIDNKIDDIDLYNYLNTV